ncbi:hypothetical protein GE061_009690, partial [Apolygus lucorum]
PTDLLDTLRKQGFQPTECERFHLQALFVRKQQRVCRVDAVPTIVFSVGRTPPPEGLGVVSTIICPDPPESIC